VPGRRPTTPSTAHVARLLDAPVVLVVDVSGAARSVAALVSGFRDFDRRVRLAGVVLNRVGSARPHRDPAGGVARHRHAGSRALPDTTPPVTRPGTSGSCPRRKRSMQAVDAVRALGALVAASCDLDALVRVARSAPPLSTKPWTRPRRSRRPPTAPEAGRGAVHGRLVRVAVAGGASFTFRLRRARRTP
jgi:cobyrinic acid a,c-diamide synthase